MNTLSELDQRLLALLTENSRASVTQLAQKLGVTRLTVQTHMERLERDRIIQGYTVHWDEGFLRRQVAAHILIAADQKQLPVLVKALVKISELKSLYSISGEYDLVAELRADSTEVLDQAMDRMTQIPGVLRTLTSVLLSKKFER